MGLFGKLFEKKECDICGGEIGLLGNRKLEDGNMCKECAKKLSPWFDERRHSTVVQIKEQLAYREENRAAVAAFRTTRSFGESQLLCMDEDKGKFYVAKTRDINKENPDVLDFSQVTGCELDIDEDRCEEKREDKDGNKVSYNPPRYRYNYDFDIVIRVNHPYFDDMRFRLNDDSVEVNSYASRLGANPGASSSAYRRYEEMGREIKEALLNARQQTRTQATAQVPQAAPEAPAAPTNAPVLCPWCGASAAPDAKGCCPYCCGPMNG